MSRNNRSARLALSRRARWVAVSAAAALAATGGAVAVSSSAALPSAAPPTVETVPVPHSGDAADDPAIWVNRANAGASTVIGTDKLGGLAVYDLAGKQLQYLPHGNMNNVDLRDGFSLGGKPVSLVTAGNRSSNSIAMYVVDPATRTLRDVAARRVVTGNDVYGSCMYRSKSSGKTYYFVNQKDGVTTQWELFEVAGGKVDAKKVRTFDVGGQVEGCTADDELGRFYIGEEAVGIWRYGAEPTAGTTRTSVDKVGGNISGDVEGMSLTYGPDDAGYLFVSGQGKNSYSVYKRSDNSFVRSFRVGNAGAIDSVEDTDGLDVTATPLGSAFPHGMFVAQDGRNSGGNQNFKFVPLQNVVPVAGATSPQPPAAQPEAVGTAGPTLQYSTNSAYTSPQPLNGARVTGKLAIFLAPGDATVTSVTFALDGKHVRTERFRPYDLAADTNNRTPARSRSSLFDTAKLAAGSHTLTASVATRSGTVAVSASFTTGASVARQVPGKPPVAGAPPARPSAEGKLTWAPPRLSKPKTYRVSGRGRTLTAKPGQDSIVVFDGPLTSRLTMKGGRHWVVRGGEVNNSVKMKDWNDQSGLQFDGVQGTAFVEGMLIHGRWGTDGIRASNSNNTTIVVQNSRIVDRWSHDGFHADVIQPYGGVKRLLVDRLTGDGNYQGVMWKQEPGKKFGPTDLRRVNFRKTAPSSQSMFNFVESAPTGPVTFTDVFHEPGRGINFCRSHYPSRGVSCGTMGDRKFVTFPNLKTRVDGRVVQGAPPGGDFVPAGAAGLGYVSPGYL